MLLISTKYMYLIYSKVFYTSQLPRTSSKVRLRAQYILYVAIESWPGLESFHKILEKSIGQFQRYLKFLISYVIKVLGFLQFAHW